VSVGSGRVEGPRVEAGTFEWRRIRRLASDNNGILYWRVRATDRYRTLSCASAVKELVIDGGEFTLGELDLTAPDPAATWRHDGEGLASYTFSALDLRRLALLARRNEVTTLHWRILGMTRDRQFTAVSQSKTTPAPDL